MAAKDAYSRIRPDDRMATAVADLTASMLNGSFVVLGTEQVVGLHRWWDQMLEATLASAGVPANVLNPPT